MIMIYSAAAQGSVYESNASDGLAAGASETVVNGTS